MSRIVGLIPARSGSKRVVGKNIRPLAGHPLMAYSIAAALESGVFENVIVSTDSEEYAAIARHYGAEVPFLRPAAYATDTSPDVEWIRYTLNTLQFDGRSWPYFAILRPTSPFRKAETIQRAWEQFSRGAADSLRAVQPCREHPGKMWRLNGAMMVPVMPLGPETQPWHSSQTNTLPRIYVQNASLEMAKTSNLGWDNIAGSLVEPFFTDESEGLDVNTERDWQMAEMLLERGLATLPPVTAAPYGASARLAPHGH